MMSLGAATEGNTLVLTLHLAVLGTCVILGNDSGLIISILILNTRGWGFTNTTICNIQDHQCEKPPEVTCAFTGCSSVPTRETKFDVMRNTKGEVVAKNSNHTLVCGDIHSDVGSTDSVSTGVFIASIDDEEIRATDIDEATAVIEELVKTKGVLPGENHKISTEILLHCEGYDTWSIRSEQFR